MQVADGSMKKIVAAFAFFVIYTFVVSTCPEVTAWDKSFLLFFQGILAGLPIAIPLLMDEILYATMIIVPYLIGGFYLLKIRKIKDLFLLFFIPLICFSLNSVFKEIIQRPRPPFDLQQVIKLTSFSYTSTHSLVMFCLWGICVYFAYKYSVLKFTKISILVFALFWVLFVGASRMWLGVHYFTDVLGAYILGMVLLMIFICISKSFERKDK